MEIGEAYEVSRTVTGDMTAAAAGSGGLQVFGTPYLLALLENAAYELLQRGLPEGQTSVGVSANIEHSAPTPLGMTVTARAELTGLSANGRLADFAVSAWDEAGPICRGTHRRAVVDAVRFTAKSETRREAKA